MVKSVFSQVHRSVRFAVNITPSLVNIVHINKIYILTPYSGYFGKIPGILSSRIIKNVLIYKITFSSLYKTAK